MTQIRMATNERQLRILEVVASSPYPLTPTEINRALGLPKQSIHRLCQNMVETGFLIRDADANRLRPSRRTRIMANGLLGLSHDHIARHQILNKLAGSLGETVNFVVPDDEGMKYLDRVDTNWPLRIQFNIGNHVPFHCTASGKLFLSTLKPKRRQRMLDSLELEQLTEHTITERNLLIKELSKTAKRGYSVDAEEFITGMVALAVPVWDSCGVFCAALAVQAPKVRLDVDDLIDMQPPLAQAATQLTRLIFEPQQSQQD